MYIFLEHPFSFHRFETSRQPDRELAANVVVMPTRLAAHKSDMKFCVMTHALTSNERDPRLFISTQLIHTADQTTAIMNSFHPLN
jgi:hypothetical protein